MLPSRRSPRWAGYDYRQPGLYFVTVCTAGRVPVLSRVEGGNVRPSALGTVVARAWADTVARRGLVPDVSVVMPDHVHLVFGIAGDEGSGDAGSALAGSVPAAVGAFKAAATRAARAAGLWGPGPLWQARFYDRVVRDEADAARVRRYVAENPARWSGPSRGAGAATPVAPCP